MQQLTSGTRCCCAPGGDFLLLLEKDFLESWIDAQFLFCLKKNFLESPGPGSCLVFFTKNAAINLRNALLLSCRGWGPFFLLEKDFFWKAGPKWIDAQFFLV